MKNLSLFVSSVVFMLAGSAQLIRYRLGVMVVVGENHHIPVELSLYAGSALALLSIWMLIAALTGNKKS